MHTTTQPTVLTKFIRALALLASLASLSTQAAADDQGQFPQFPWLGERKIMGANNLEAIAQVQGTSAYDFSRVVARVETAEGNGYCTGSRVGENLFLTNFHCDIGCDNMQFTMGYEAGIDAADRATFKCKELVQKYETLDYALYLVDQPAAPAPTPSTYAATDALESFASFYMPPPPVLQYPVLALYKGPLVQGLPLIVPGHPSTRLKEIDRSDECFLSDIEVMHTDSGRDTLKHMCDTEGGSSGSPVIDRERGYAVALHWGGRTGEFNFGISMRMILEHMQANIPAAVYDQLTVVE